MSRSTGIFIIIMVLFIFVAFGTLIYGIHYMNKATNECKAKIAEHYQQKQKSITPKTGKYETIDVDISWHVVVVHMRANGHTYFIWKDRGVYVTHDPDCEKCLKKQIKHKEIDHE